GSLRLMEPQQLLTSATVAWDGEKFAVQAKKEPFALGMQISLQPAVSSDHRSVNLNLALNKTSLQTEKICVCPVIFSLPCPESPGPMKTITQPLEAPKIAKVNLKCKLALPDGKTAVLMGWKGTEEVTNAIPLLSSFPLIGKLYTDKQKEPVTTLVLVTPRIIVEPEEEHP